MTDAVKPGAVMFARDVAALTRFYAAVMPMRLIDEADGAAILETDSIQLIIHPLPGNMAPDTDKPAPRTHAAVKLVFAVDDLDRVRAAAQALGGGLAPASTGFVWRGFHACDGHDPEGNVIQFRMAVG